MQRGNVGWEVFLRFLLIQVVTAGNRTQNPLINYSLTPLPSGSPAPIHIVSFKAKGSIYQSFVYTVTPFCLEADDIYLPTILCSSLWYTLIYHWYTYQRYFVHPFDILWYTIDILTNHPLYIPLIYFVIPLIYLPTIFCSSLWYTLIYH